MQRLILRSWPYHEVRRILTANPHWRVIVVSLAVWAWYLANLFVVTTANHAQHTLHTHHVSTTDASWPVFDNLAAWLLMVCAMMLPILSGAVRFITQSMPKYQHEKAIALLVLGYALVWLTIGLVIESVAYVAHSLQLGNLVAGWPLATLAFITAGLWNQHRLRRSAVFACGNGIAMRINGWQALADAIWFGIIKGKRCVTSCLHLMLAMLIVGHDLLLMAGITCVLLYEKSAQPRQTIWVSATCFMLASGYFLHWAYTL